MRRLVAILACWLCTSPALALDPARNFAVCQLSVGYDFAATSLVALAGCAAKLPVPSSDGPFNLVWFNATDYVRPDLDPAVEIIRATALSGETLTVTRAQEGTTAVNHNLVGRVYQLVLAPTAKLVTDLNRAGSVTFAGGETSTTITGLTGLSAATYRVHVDRTWNTEVWIPASDKTTSQFVVHFANPPAAADVLRWWVLP